MKEDDQTLFPFEKAFFKPLSARDMVKFLKKKMLNITVHRLEPTDEELQPP